jgi:hypothetical protein
LGKGMGQIPLGHHLYLLPLEGHLIFLLRTTPLFLYDTGYDLGDFLRIPVLNP